MENVVKACPNVEYLSLDGCSKIDDAAIDLITNKLKRLRQLDLYSCIKVTTSKAIDYLIQNCNRLQVGKSCSVRNTVEWGEMD